VAGNPGLYDTSDSQTRPVDTAPLAALSPDTAVDVKLVCIAALAGQIEIYGRACDIVSARQKL